MAAIPKDSGKPADATSTKASEEKTSSSAETSKSPDSPSPAIPSLASNIPEIPLRANDPNSFRIISDRNIFDQNRRARTRSGPPVRRIRVDSFSLVGTMSYEKGNYAFFDGSGSQYKMARRADEKIAGFIVKRVTPDSVTLESGGKEIDLKIGMQLRKQEDEDWKLSAGSESGGRRTFSFSDSNSGTNSSSGGNDAQADTTSEAASTSSGDLSEIERRLMERKEKENNK
jgi:hypothetical protein